MLLCCGSSCFFQIFKGALHPEILFHPEVACRCACDGRQQRRLGMECGVKFARSIGTFKYRDWKPLSRYARSLGHQFLNSRSGGGLFVPCHLSCRMGRDARAGYIFGAGWGDEDGTIATDRAFSSRNLSQLKISLHAYSRARTNEQRPPRSKTRLPASFAIHKTTLPARGRTPRFRHLGRNTTEY